MFCICLVDLLSPFILLQLLSELSVFSFAFPYNLCHSPTLLSFLAWCCSAASSFLYQLWRWCQQCQHWHWASKPDWKQQRFSRTSEESLG